MSLTPYERETVILLNDGEDTAIISTHQRTMLTKLERNPGATKVEDLTHSGQKGARFVIDAKLVSIRQPRKAMTPGQKAAAAARLRSETP